MCLQEQEMLVEKVKGFPDLYDKRVKGFKQKDAVKNAWQKVAESSDFEENDSFVRASSNWEYFEGSCSERIDAIVLYPKFLQNISKPIRFSHILFWILIDWQFKTVFSNNISHKPLCLISHFFNRKISSSSKKIW